MIRKAIYIILLTTASIYFILYPLAMGLWMLAFQTWGVSPPWKITGANWLEIIVAGAFILGLMYRIGPLAFPRWTRSMSAYQWYEFGLLQSLVLVTATYLLWASIVSNNSNRYVYLIPGSFLAVFFLAWAFIRPLQILGLIPKQLWNSSHPRSDKRVLGMLRTERLFLLALKREQLQLYLDNLPGLERELSIRISRDILSEQLKRAIKMKIKKMKRAEEVDHPWYTYWLIVTAKKPFGAGLAGFKGVPNEHGSVEIGYGIDPSYQNQGYMTETVRALVDWAFLHLSCTKVTATEVENPASRRVLEKLGAHLVAEDENSTSWEFRKG